MRFLRIVVANLIALGAPGAAVSQQPELIQQAQRVLVFALDSTFPPVPLEQWLAELARRSTKAIRWETNDCGEGGDGLEAPSCVEAQLDLTSETTAHLSLVVAGLDGTPGKPVIWMLYASRGDSIRNFAKLRDWVAVVRGS